MWVFSTGVGSGHEAAPVVVNGVMFLSTPEHRVVAIDAVTGVLLWRYIKEVEESIIAPHPTTRGIALHGTKVFFAANDATLVALDARTGAQAWSAKVAENKDGYYMTLAPLVADGKVIVGAVGRRARRAWLRRRLRRRDRRAAVALLHLPAPGEPGSETWPAGATSGRTAARPVWVTGNYDPATNLVVLGYRQRRAVDGRPAPGDNLYTASTVAIDVATGRIKGHFQYHPNDSWDWDEVSPPILVDFQRNGRTVKGLIDVARNGYLWFLERSERPDQVRGGEAVRAADRVPQPRPGHRHGPMSTRTASPAPARSPTSARRTGAARTGRRSPSTRRRG